MSHYVTKCKHGKLGRQCRCPSSDKFTRTVSCYEAGCLEAEPLTDEEITQEAWRQVLAGAQSSHENWIDEDGEYTESDFRKIYKKGFDIIRELEQENL